MLRIPLQVTTVLLSLLLLVTGTALAADTAPRVVVSIKPIHSLVAGVMQGIGEPALLLEGGESPHSYALKPSDARMLQKADLIIWVGHTMESFLVKPVANLSGNAHSLELMDELQGLMLAVREGGSWDAHSHRPDADADADADADHNHDAELRRDPHLWLSPKMATEIVSAVEQTLSRIDAAHQLQYQNNAHQLRQRLEQLDAKLDAQLAPVRQVPFIVFHDAYQYFEKSYRLTAIGSITVSPEQQPGAKRISELRDKIVTLKARCVFAEPQFQPRMIKTLIEKTQAKSGVLDPLGASLKAGPESYFILLQQMADNLLAGLQ